MGILRLNRSVATVQMGSVGVEPTPADFQSAASTELAYFPYCDTFFSIAMSLEKVYSYISRFFH